MRQRPIQASLFCHRFSVLIGILALAGSPVRAANPGALLDLSLEQLSQVEIKTDIMSIRAKPVEEQPGIVSVITAADIHQSGARDLSDILMQVPGFSLDTDVESMIGLTFRGLQGQEGKALLIVDGMELNEPLYGSLPILNRVSADLIKQVEIIRGPGSAQYGGSAGLSVIRVTTRDSSQNAGYATFTPAYTGDRFSETYTAGAGYEKGDWRYSINASHVSSFLANRSYTALDGTSVNLTHTANMDPSFVDLGVGWRGGDIKLIYDRYRYDDVINYGETVPTPNDTHFDSVLGLAKYDLPVGESLHLIPSFSYRYQIPWYVDGADGKYDLHTFRYQGDLTAIADLSPKSSLLLGGRWQKDSVNVNDSSYYGVDPETYYYGARSVAYVDQAVFAQYDYDASWANLSIGGRYEHHDAIGGHFVPRTALTKAWGPWHVKLLASAANRIPAINVLQEAVGGPLKPEQTANYEVELGYKFAEGCSITTNVFYMAVQKPIVFETTADGSNTEGYFNGHDISSAGFESELKWKKDKWSSYLGYSYYQAVDNQEPYVRGDQNRFLGAPTHKIAFSSTWSLTPQLDCNVNGFWLSSRRAYEYPNPDVTSLDPEFVANTYAEYRWRRLSFGLGFANLFDVKRYAPQPYNGGEGPVPLMGRTVFLKLGCKF